MASVGIGSRVGAVQKADEKTVWIFGYGVYNGMQKSPLGFSNPQLILDDGQIVWGYECWWASEDQIRELIGDKEVVKVNKEDVE